MASLFATRDSLFATRLARRDSGFMSACADFRTFCNSVAAVGGGVVAFRDTVRAFRDKSCVKVGRGRRLACQRCGLGFDGRPCTGWRMGKKTAKCYKNGHARRGWRHLRHVKEQKRPATGDERNQQGEARCAMGTCGMGVGWWPRCLDPWRCVSGVLKRRSLRLHRRLSQWIQSFAGARCVMGLGLGQRLSDQHIRTNPVRPLQTTALLFANI